MSKTKPWEAQVPGTERKLDKLERVVLFGAESIPEQDTRDPSSLVLKLSEPEFQELLVSLKQHKIGIKNWQELEFLGYDWHTNDLVSRYVIRFRTAEDAMAYKLTYE